MQFLQILGTEPERYLAAVLTIIVSITLHELAHGWAAMKLGDDTPEYSGHMTWNPYVHMGPFSLLACFVAGIAWGQMPVDPTRLRGKHAEAIVAFAGPAVNLVLAILALTVLGLWMGPGGAAGSEDHRVLNGLMVLEVVGFFNLLLFVFNLLPVPPLDGSKILATFHRGYANWIYDPANQGIGLVLFVAAFILARIIVEPIADLGFAYVAALASLG